MAKKATVNGIDPHPGVDGKAGNNKVALRTSGTGAIRRREPTNEFTASKMTNMVWDFSNQQAFWPDGKPNALVEATQQHNIRDYRTMNRSGHPYALGVSVGGSPDDGGDAFSKPPKAKILK